MSKSAPRLSKSSQPLLWPLRFIIHISAPSWKRQSRPVFSWPWPRTIFRYRQTSKVHSNIRGIWLRCKCKRYRAVTSPSPRCSKYPISSHLPHNFRRPPLHRPSPSLTVSKRTSPSIPHTCLFLLTICTPPASSQGFKFLHWLTSKRRRSLHDSTMASTPAPVTRTQPRTESSRNSSRCRAIHDSEPSDTAEPQKARFR